MLPAVGLPRGLSGVWGYPVAAQERAGVLTGRTLLLERMMISSGRRYAEFASLRF